MTLLGKLFVIVNMLLPLGLLWPGVILDIYSIVVNGVMRRFLGEQMDREYSIWTSGTSILPDHLSDSPGTVFVLIIYLVRAIWFGVLFVFSGLIIWLVPLSLRGHRAMHVICEFCNAWHGVDVLEEKTFF